MLKDDYVLVFDKDGVITDTETFKLTLLENLLIADFPELADQIKQFNHSHRGMYRAIKIQQIFEQIIQKKIGQQTLNLYLEKFAQQMTNQLSQIKLVPGVSEFIKQRHGVQFISSAAPAIEVEEHMDYFGFTPYFETLYTSPAYTDKYLALKEIQQACNKKVLFFGDSLSDLHFSQKAGVGFIGITYCSDVFKDEKDILLLPDFSQAAEKIAAFSF
jgi:phosphoglycolate phosphatase-like HAD superfamily hydrolase